MAFNRLDSGYFHTPFGKENASYFQLVEHILHKSDWRRTFRVSLHLPVPFSTYLGGGESISGRSGLKSNGQVWLESIQDLMHDSQNVCPQQEVTTGWQNTSWHIMHNNSFSSLGEASTKRDCSYPGIVEVKSFEWNENECCVHGNMESMGFARERRQRLWAILNDARYFKSNETNWWNRTSTFILPETAIENGKFNNE